MHYYRDCPSRFGIIGVAAGQDGHEKGTTLHTKRSNNVEIK